MTTQSLWDILRFTTVWRWKQHDVPRVTATGRVMGYRKAWLTVGQHRAVAWNPNRLHEFLRGGQK